MLYRFYMFNIFCFLLGINMDLGFLKPWLATNVGPLNPFNQSYYTPGIYTEGYIVFAFLFVCLFIHD